jgi:hypothetical protein
MAIASYVKGDNSLRHAYRATTAFALCVQGDNIRKGRQSHSLYALRATTVCIALMSSTTAAIPQKPAITLVKVIVLKRNLLITKRKKKYTSVLVQKECMN